MSNPFFSICIPNYNYCKYLKLTIESVLHQSFQDFEIIVSDNASTDDSVAVVKSFNDSRIFIVENSINLGFTPNLDKCTELATGLYMILLSSDDIMLPDALETYFNIISSTENKRLIIMSECNIINSFGDVVGKKKSMTGDVEQYLNRNKIFPVKFNEKYSALYYKSKDILRGLLLGTFQPAGQFLTTCYSADMYKELCGYRSIMSISPDAHFSHRLLFLEPTVIYIQKKLFEYRIHQENNYSAALNFAHIKRMTDAYLFSKQYDDALLGKIDLKSEDLEYTFINHIIFREAFWSLIRGRVMKGIRLLSFGVAAYPNKILCNIKFFGLSLIVLITPVLSILFKLKKLLQSNKSEHAV